jgi:hypothetical protein
LFQGKTEPVPVTLIDAGYPEEQGVVTVALTNWPPVPIKEAGRSEVT